MKPNSSLESLVAQLPAELSVPPAMDAKLLAAIQQTPQIQHSPVSSDETQVDVQPQDLVAQATVPNDATTWTNAKTVAPTRGKGAASTWLALAASVGLLWLGAGFFKSELLAPQLWPTSIVAAWTNSSVSAPDVTHKFASHDAAAAMAAVENHDDSNTQVLELAATEPWLGNRSTRLQPNASWLSQLKPDIAVLLSGYTQLPSGFEDSLQQLQQFAKTRVQLTSTLEDMSSASPKVQAMLWRQLAALEQRERDYLRKLLAAS